MHRGCRLAVVCHHLPATARTSHAWCLSWGAVTPHFTIIFLYIFTDIVEFSITHATCLTFDVTNLGRETDELAWRVISCGTRDA